MGEFVGVGAGDAEFAPPYTEAHDDAGPHAVRDADPAAVLAAIIVGPDQRALLEAASLGWISSNGSPSMLRRLMTLTNVELRKCRAGGEIMASG